MYPYRFSNVLLGYLNLISLLASIPIIGAGLWLTRSSASCASFIQAPLLAVGFVVLILSLAGFVGSCFHVAWALWLYLAILLLLIATMTVGAAFAFAVTSGGGGVQITGRPYREYKLNDYSSWLRHRVADDGSWRAALACIVGSRACANILTWNPLDYLKHDLTPTQSGCCKPPTACAYTGGVAADGQDGDCYRWSNAPSVLCYGCDSCKAGVLEQVRQDWHKVSVLVIVVIVVLVLIYAIACCAYRNARRALSEYPYGENGMSKIHPRWDYDWGRWWRDLREYW